MAAARYARILFERPLLNLGVRRIEAGMDARGGATGALYMISIYFQGDRLFRLRGPTGRL